MIAVENLSVRAGAFRLDGVSFAVGAGEYAALMGKTGSGKTTILEAICGLKRAWADLRPNEMRAGRTPPEGTDDVAFIVKLVDTYVADGTADPRRVYVTGLSNGGAMTMTLACKRAGADTSRSTSSTKRAPVSSRSRISNAAPAFWNASALRNWC